MEKHTTPIVGCVIMASGASRRFGSNKLLADFNGRPMISCLLDTTDSLFSRRIVVTRHSAVAELCQSRSIPVLLHDLPLRSDTVRLGLQALGTDMDACLFCPSDQPLLRRETLARLLEKNAQDPDRIWRPVFQDKVGAPILFPQWAFSELLQLPAGKGGGHVIAQHTDLVGTISVTDPYELIDVDTPDTLQMLLHQRKKGSPL